MSFSTSFPTASMPDCAIFMPDNTHLVIDAKFPLEAITALRNAANDDERKQATARVKQDIVKHVVDISEKYLIPGETQDIALMFIPSESVYAELYERFDDVMQRAHRAKVMIVSPTLMVLAIQVIKHLRKDAQMREAVGLIQLRDRTHAERCPAALRAREQAEGHFGQTARTSTTFWLPPARSKNAPARSKSSNSTAKSRASFRCLSRRRAGCARRNDLRPSLAADWRFAVRSANSSG